jgi:interferon-induced GTP-binding protein Mx1
MANIIESDNYKNDILPLLNLFDEIRSILGDSESSIELPSLAVIGNQSSGKSTVLERISGLSLPRGHFCNFVVNRLIFINY